MRVPTSDFTYDSHTKTFTTEASDLRHGALGEEFTLVSSRTGIGISVRHMATFRDTDNDVTYWKYAPADGKFTVHIYND